MNQFERFQHALRLENIEDNVFLVNPDTNYFVGNTPHGGYLMAVMHKALTSILPHSTAISSSVQYLDRIDAKPFQLEVETFKVSKGSSSGIVKLIQDDKICTTFTGTCSDFEFMKGYDDLQKPLPSIFSDKDKNDYVKMNYDKISKGFTPAFIQQLEIDKEHCIKLKNNMQLELNQWYVQDSTYQALIKDMEHTIELRDKLIKDVTPKWWENKWLWFGAGVVLMGSVNSIVD